ncbi:MAG: hypothetical protein ACOYMW_07145 [Candidatus Competibacteraceae bacterium]
MVTREPKCVYWKRKGAEAVASQIAGLTDQQELKFWQEQTQQLRLLQTGIRQRLKQLAPAIEV